MARAVITRRLVPGLVVATLSLGLAGLWLRGQGATPQAPARAMTSDALAGNDGPDLVSALEGLSWNDIAPTVEGTGASDDRRRTIVSAAELSVRPEVRYLQGLLLLALNHPGEALHTFLAIEPSVIPPAYLYAPYRLHAELKPGSFNPFSDGLRRAMAMGQLPPLITARISAEDGDLESALRSYLNTDPGQWATRDVEVFRLLGLHLGLAPEAARMVAGALRAGRVRPELRGAIAAAVLSGNTPPTAAQLAALSELLRKNPEARSVAVAAAARALRARQLFLKREFKTLVADYHGESALTLPDVTLLMLVLASTEAGTKPDADMWRQELRRRYPQEEVRVWLAGLKGRAR